MTKPPAREVATARPVPSPLSLQAKAKATSRPVAKPVARAVPPAKRSASAPRVRTPPGPVAAELPHTGVVCRPRPNSRVTRGHLGSINRQSGLHVEFEAAVRVHVLPDQRRQGTKISESELS